MNICKLCDGELLCDITIPNSQRGFLATYSCSSCNTEYEKFYQVISINNIKGGDDHVITDINKCPDCGLIVNAAYLDELRINQTSSSQCIYCCKCHTIWQQKFKHTAFSLHF